MNRKGANKLYDLIQRVLKLYTIWLGVLKIYTIWILRKSELHIDKKPKKCYNFYKFIEKCRWVFITYKETVKKLRFKMLMTQEIFAKLLDDSHATINRWKTGKYIPTIKSRGKL